jgi:putative chitinase
MNSDARFYDAVRSGLLGPTLSPSEVNGCTAILAAMAGAPLAWTAYALATAYKETNHTMQPIEEMGGSAYFFRRYDPQGQRPDIAAQVGNTHPGDGVLFHGRGYVQLTGRANYAKATQKLGLDLIAQPEDALKDDVAAKVMRRGMQEGWFTGKSFSSYLPGSRPAPHDHYREARRIINGIDCAEEIADYAVQFEAALVAGGWA